MTDATLGGLPIAVSDELESPARRALRRLFKRKGAVAGLVVIATFILLAVFAPLISPYEPIATSWSLVRKPPSALHWFGTDELGRDILARVIYGARASLLAGAISVGIALSHRRTARPAVGLSRRLHRRPDQPHDGRDAGLPVPDPRHCAGGVSRAPASAMP